MVTPNKKEGEAGPMAAPALGVPGNGQLAGTETVGVDKIRDLLFGNQMQDYDRRFSNLEERFLQRLKDVEAESSRGLSAFELNSKKQIDSVVGQLREEKDRRADAEKEIERNFRDQFQALDRRMRQLSDQVAQIERDFTDRLTQEAQALRDEVKRRNDDTRHTIERMFAELSGVKTDRNLLAGLFVEVAKALNQDAGAKGTDTARNWHGG